jgi:hypothetical protein
MRGRAVTAWFEVPWDAAATAMSPDLMPPQQPTIRARLRFYDMGFAAVATPAAPLAPTEGRFREGVVAFAASGGGLEGEVSLFLWTDSPTYLMCGREAFGWPLGLADVNLSGDFWSQKLAIGSGGAAELADQWGTACLADIVVTGEATSGTPGGHWLTPYRALRAAGCQGEIRELLIVRPEIRSPGTTWHGTGRPNFDLAPAHPLEFLNDIEGTTAVEIADNFELLVGADVLIANRAGSP